MSAKDKAVYTAYRLCRRYHMPPKESAMCAAWLYPSEQVMRSITNTVLTILLEPIIKRRCDFSVSEEAYYSGISIVQRDRKAIKHGLMKRLEGR